MNSAIPPSSSVLPEEDWEVSKVEESKVIKRDVKEGDLRKGDESWASRVKDKRVLKKYDVEIQSKDGKNKVVIPEEIFTDSTPLWEEFVVGNFLNIAPHIAKVHMVVNKIWSYGDQSSKVEVYDVDAKTMRFKISSLKAREKVIKRGMWNIAGVPIVVKKWSPKAEEEKQEEETIPMWVHLTKIPISTFSWEALSFMTSAVGHPVRLHPETIACSNFEEAKVFVNVDVTKTLPKEIDFTWGGKEFTAGFFYPWLPARCGLCEKWGHTDKVCGIKRREKKSDVRSKEEGSQNRAKEVGEMSVKKVSEKLENIQKKNLGSVDLDKPMEGELTKVIEAAKGDEWLDVSPGRIGRAQTTTEVTEVQISASKFSVLSVDEVEEGEISVTLEEEVMETGR